MVTSVACELTRPGTGTEVNVPGTPGKGVEFPAPSPIASGGASVVVVSG